MTRVRTPPIGRISRCGAILAGIALATLSAGAAHAAAPPVPSVPTVPAPPTTAPAPPTTIVEVDVGVGAPPPPPLPSPSAAPVATTNLVGGVAVTTAIVAAAGPTLPNTGVTATGELPETGSSRSLGALATGFVVAGLAIRRGARRTGSGAA